MPRLLAPPRGAPGGVLASIGGAAAWAIAGALVALVPALWMWGFTVDDALISVRYSRHLASGMGWRFNPHGPTSDGVTPLPWPLLLAPLARADALRVLLRAQAVGLAAWIAAAAALGGAIGRTRATPSWARAAVLAVVALSVPLAAHAVSGMETAIATLLATAAALSSARPRVAALVAGGAASLRPEMGPWALVLAVGFSLAVPASAPRWRARLWAAAALALGPFVACSLVRAAVWGRPAPLAVLAKPSDLAHGLPYAGAALVVTLVPLLVLAPLALHRSPIAASLVAAAIAHVATVAAVGGDWMPYARLLVPIVPSLAYAAVLVAAHARRWATAGRSALALGVGVLLVARGGTDGRRVGTDRAALVAMARPWLAPARRVAVLDAGWVSAATEADIVDLAGVTDLAIAVLPGGHTSKHVGATFLLERDPDLLLLYLPLGLPEGRPGRWREATYVRALEARLAADDVIARHFTPATWLPLGAKGAGYVVLRRTLATDAPNETEREP